MLHAVDFEGQTKDQEYWAIRNGATLWDVGVERPVEIDGPEGFALMDLLTPRDMRKCAIGQGKYALICDEHGAVVNDPVVLRMGENRFWLCPSDSDVHLWAKGVAVGAGLRATVRLTDVYPVQIQGPKSPDVLEAIIGDRIRTLRYYWWMEAQFPGKIPVMITRTGWTGEVGYEVFLMDNSRAEEMVKLIMERGKPYGPIPAGPDHPPRARECGSGAGGASRDIRRAWSHCRSSTRRRRSPSAGWTPRSAPHARQPLEPAAITTMPITIEEAIHRIPKWEEASSLDIALLPGGITNLNYRVDVSGESFVVRIAAPYHPVGYRPSPRVS